MIFFIWHMFNIDRTIEPFVRVTYVAKYLCSFLVDEQQQCQKKKNNKKTITRGMDLFSVVMEGCLCSLQNRKYPVLQNHKFAFYFAPSLLSHLHPSLLFFFQTYLNGMRNG